MLCGPDNLPTSCNLTESTALGVTHSHWAHGESLGLPVDGGGEQTDGAQDRGVGPREAQVGKGQDAPGRSPFPPGAACRM